ncbi:MAG: pirin family protein [Polyangiaceae bacterium]|nr:pirin family protein [Polyangiaceae bacterium]
MPDNPFDPAAAILRVAPLAFPYETQDPFLFCVHHDDHYPAGNEHLGPRASLAGRDLGRDFVIRDGWRMYHGETVPGFPQHPHRGFETVTVVRRGFIDHSDSMGAAGRYGEGDVQWMTAGSGVQHAEMFPLLDRDGPNPVELFQIWLNLPAKSKPVAPYFAMLWSKRIPRREVWDENGRATHLTLVAGAYERLTPPAPPPDSWASQADSDVAIWTLRMDAGANVLVPAARPGTNRTLYFFSGEGLTIGARGVPASHLIEVRGDVALPLRATAGPIELLLLQGRPIGEPVVQQGPFVMNSRDQIVQTVRDFQRTQFGGWPWTRRDQVHGRERGRFARHADGREEYPE